MPFAVKNICKRRNFMKEKKTSYQKLIHSFVCAAVIISSCILVAMGVFATKNNTDALDSGIQPAMIYAAREDEAISVKIDKSVYTSDKIKKFPTDTVLSLVPAPVGNIYIIYKNAKSVINDYFGRTTD